MARAKKKPEARSTGGAPIKQRFGDHLRALRERAGLSQGELADASGLSRVFFGTVERAVKSASLETIEKLAHGLGVTPADLLRFDAVAPDESQAMAMGRRIAKIAEGARANPEKLARFERVARLFFVADQ